MCMSVPQMAERCTLISTSLCPTAGSGTSCIQMPGSARALTSAFICGPSLDDAEIASRAAECGDDRVELLGRMRGAHLRTDPRLTLGHDREGERDDVDARGEHALGETHGERRLAEHDRNDRMLAGQQSEAQCLEPGAEMPCVEVYALAQFRGSFQQFEHTDRRGGDRRR